MNTDPRLEGPSWGGGGRLGSQRVGREVLASSLGPVRAACLGPDRSVGPFGSISAREQEGGGESLTWDSRRPAWSLLEMCEGAQAQGEAGTRSAAAPAQHV